MRKKAKAPQHRRVRWTNQTMQILCVRVTPTPQGSRQTHGQTAPDGTTRPAREWAAAWRMRMDGRRRRVRLQPRKSAAPAQRFTRVKAPHPRPALTPALPSVVSASPKPQQWHTTCRSGVGLVSVWRLAVLAATRRMPISRWRHMVWDALAMLERRRSWRVHAPLAAASGCANLLGGQPLAQQRLAAARPIAARTPRRHA